MHPVSTLCGSRENRIGLRLSHFFRISGDSDFGLSLGPSCKETVNTSTHRRGNQVFAIPMRRVPARCTNVRLRILLYNRREGLLSYDIMTHDEIRKFLRGL